MSDARSIVEKLYAAFAAHDGATMASLYSDDATFGDPVFPSLRGQEIGDMWRMLTARAHDLALELGEIKPAEDGEFIAPWIARYTFSATGRKVENHVTSSLRIEQEKIVRHRDVFDFRSWQAQALGAFGLLLGWTGLPGRIVQKQAAKGLAAFRAKHGA